MKAKKGKKRLTEDERSRRKYDRGGRIEAYSMGEVLSEKGRNWPFTDKPKKKKRVKKGR